LICQIANERHGPCNTLILLAWCEYIKGVGRSSASHRVSAPDAQPVRLTQFQFEAGGVPDPNTARCCLSLPSFERLSGKQRWLCGTIGGLLVVAVVVSFSRVDSLPWLLSLFTAGVGLGTSSAASSCWLWLPRWLWQPPRTKAGRASRNAERYSQPPSASHCSARRDLYGGALGGAHGRILCRRGLSVSCTLSVSWVFQHDGHSARRGCKAESLPSAARRPCRVVGYCSSLPVEILWLCWVTTETVRREP
jgi:hypothetical protein